MLSILIPTYNYACAHLVCDLQKQCEEAQALLGDFTYEIIVADDGSTDADTLQKNAVIDYLPSCRIIEADHNIGRAAIRNLLIRESRGQWVLIIDADAEVITDDFILTYLQAAGNSTTAAGNSTTAAGVPTPTAAPATPTPAAGVPTPTAAPATPTIIIGGLKNPPQAPQGCELRYRYELASDSLRTLEARRRQPAMFFSTFNFMATRTVFDHILFDERCTDYGYEDALLGIEAETRHFNIIHIDNPLQHNGINTNAAFLRNSETALRTLRHLGPPMTDRARVAQAAARFTTPKWRRFTLRPLIIILYKMSRPLIRRNLLSPHPNLHLFAFYKLGYYLTL